MDEKEMRLHLLKRARLNINSNRDILLLVEDEKMIAEIKANLDREEEYLNKWIKEEMVADG